MSLPSSADLSSIWKRLTKRILVDKTLPRRGQAASRERWTEVLDWVNQGIKERQLQITKEVQQDQQRQLQAALGRICADFGRRRRTFRAALLRKPPNIPLWGVMSSHPDTIRFSTWQQEALNAVIPASVWERVQLGRQAGCLTLTCAQHTDVAAILQLVPPGECTVLAVR